MGTPRDPRLWPATARVAHVSLAGQVDLPLSEGMPLRACVPVTDIWDAQGRRDRQLVFGEEFIVLDEERGRSFGFAARDRHVGTVASADLRAGEMPTHRVRVRASHLYVAPDLKSAEVASLSYGSLLRVTGTENRFAQVSGGYFLPLVHLAGIDELAEDPVGEAEKLLGTPYLWGGNSAFGVDCSGLVQLAFRVAGVDCPSDSDLQEAALGEVIPPSAEVRRGDLFFWKGHVAIALDATRLIHANAFSMAVSVENLEQALDRIRAGGGGELRCRRRVRLRAVRG